MVNKKAQGISISFIVIAAIAALVLVLVIAFATGGLGKFFGNIFKAGGGGESETDIKLAQTDCESYCNNAKTGSYGAWASSSYCSKQFGIDMDGDGTINSTTERFHCWEAPISVRCQSTMTDAYGYGITCEEDNCPTDAEPNNECCGTGCKESSFGNTLDCSAITDEDDCNAFSACNWVGNCVLDVASAPECNSLSKDVCNIAEDHSAGCEGWKQLEYSSAETECY